MKSDLQKCRTLSSPLLQGQQWEKTALPARCREVLKVAVCRGGLDLGGFHFLPGGPSGDHKGN